MANGLANSLKIVHSAPLCGGLVLSSTVAAEVIAAKWKKPFVRRKRRGQVWLTPNPPPPNTAEGRARSPLRAAPPPPSPSVFQLSTSNNDEHDRNPSRI
jgi:hypothetical protein